MLNKNDFEQLLNESPQEGGLNKADIQFAVRAYLKGLRKDAVDLPLVKLTMQNFLEFVEEM